MASLSLTTRLKIAEWYLDSGSEGGATASLTVSGTKFTNQRIATSTTAAALPVGGVTTAGWLYAKNVDATDSISISLISDGSTPFTTLAAGESLILPLATTTLYTKASANTPTLAFILVDG